MKILVPILRTMWRQRRSACIAVLSCFVGVLLTQDLTWARDALETDPSWVGVMVLTAAVLITSLIVALCTVLICVLLPGFRGIPIMLSVALPIIELGYSVLPHDASWIGVWPFAVTLPICWLLFFPHIDRWLPTWHGVSRAHFFTSATPQEILEAAIPGLGPVASYFGNLHDVRTVAEQPTVRYVRYAFGRGVFEEQIVTIGALDDRGGSYHHINDASPEIASLTEGVFTIQIDGPDSKGWRKVTLITEMKALPIRIAFLSWLFDTSGERADSVAAKLNRTIDPSVAGREARFAKSQA